LVLAVLLPVWIPVDYLLLPLTDFLPLAALRLGAGGLALTLYFLSSDSGSRLAGALARLAALLFLPAALYVAARLQLQSGSDNLLYGYAFFPILMAAMLAVFPLTLVEGLALGLPVLLGYGALELVLGTPLDPSWLGMLWLLSLVALISLWTQLSQLRMLLDLFRRATRDTVTGVFNRRNLTERLEAEHARWERHGRPLTLLQIELGGLERITNEHGAAVANRLLAQLADVIERALRPTDLIGRWNADTLLAVLPETDDETARRMAGRVREVSELASVPLATGGTLRAEARITVVAPVPRENLTRLMTRIDHKLAAPSRVAAVG
ncbi:MAG TPA: diguanylate cyclase, partial [Gammaproteobacteria bacterium]|nr:diguanylate cyclase [Gammaproteobacteria bacterium]